MIYSLTKKKIAESNLREILSRTTCLLNQAKETYRFSVRDNQLHERFELQVLMGRQEFQEIYTLKYDDLQNNAFCKFRYDNFSREIEANLRLSKVFFK